MKNVLQRTLLLTLTGVLVACSEGSDPLVVDDTPVLTIAPTTISLKMGEKVNVLATVTNAVNAAVIWRSASPLVATVSVTGEVTPVSPGTTVITAISVQDTTVRAHSNVTVTLADPIQASILVLGNGPVPERYTAEIAARGDWAYTTTWGNRGVQGNAVKVWNVAGNTPLLRDSIIASGGVGTVSDVQISDDGTLLVISTEGGFGSIKLYNRSDPQRPALLTTFTSANTTRGVHTVKLSRINGRHYAFLSVNQGTGSPARLVIADITNPSAPVEIFMQVMGRPFVHDVHIRDGLLFTALWHDGMSIFDVGGGSRGGSPSNPVLISNIPTLSGSIHNIQWFHDPKTGSKKYVFLGEEAPAAVLSNAAGNIHVIDITDITQPRQVAEFAVTGAGAHNFAIDEPSGILYSAYYNGGVRALDIRGDLGTCTAAQRTARGFCDLRLLGREAASVLAGGGAYVWGVALQGNTLYASDMKSGIYKLDVTNLKRP